MLRINQLTGLYMMGIWGVNDMVNTSAILETS